MRERHSNEFLRPENAMRALSSNLSLGLLYGCGRVRERNGAKSSLLPIEDVVLRGESEGDCLAASSQSSRDSDSGEGCDPACEETSILGRTR